MSLADTIGRFIIAETRSYGRPMNNDECMNMLGAIAFDVKMDEKEAAELHEDLMKDFAYRLMYDRLSFHVPNKVTPTALLFFVALTDRPGNAVLFCAVMAELCKQLPEGATLTFTDAVNAFPFAVPTEDIMSKAWDKQKRIERDGQTFDNGLDQEWAWK